MTEARVTVLHGLSSRASSLGVAALVIAAAMLVGRQSVVTNLERGCMVGDTPYLELCAPAPNPQLRASQLKSEIDSNPGDSFAYVHLASAAGKSASAVPLLAAAARVAPANPTVTAMQAAQALEQQDLPTAVGPLVSLVEHDYNDRAAMVLARLIGSGRWQLLAEHLRPGTRWFSRVLAQMPNAQGPFSAALPLVVLGLDRGVFAPRELMPYVHQLKASGAWNDAYALWVALHQGASPIIYNAGFDQPFEEDGFDWEPAPQHPIGRSGAIVARAAEPARGSVLDIRFTGRPFSVPLIRQNLFLGPGRYRLRGDYKTAQLRMEQGLAWTVRCTASAAQAGKSAGLRDTANAWQTFEFVFSVPPDCGWVATLQLETFTPLEATLGSRGRASFDALELKRLEQ
jgi:hypothetical protein